LKNTAIDVCYGQLQGCLMLDKIWQLFVQFMANFWLKVFDDGNVIGNNDFSILKMFLQFIFFHTF